MLQLLARFYLTSDDGRPVLETSVYRPDADVYDHVVLDERPFPHGDINLNTRRVFESAEEAMSHALNRNGWYGLANTEVAP